MLSNCTCLYLAFAYYWHSVKGNPQLRNWTDWKAKAMQGEDVVLSPKAREAGPRNIDGIRGGRGRGKDAFLAVVEANSASKHRHRRAVRRTL